MKISDLKYLMAFIIPALVYWGLYSGSWLSYSAFIFAFVIVPILEPILSKSEENLDPEEAEAKSGMVFFDFLLYLNVPIVFGLLYYFGLQVSSGVYSGFELTGNLLSMGLLLGSSGINVAHELGHKNSLLAKTSAILLLTPSLYTHFYVEHNRGHHKNVATPEDPATAFKGMSLYRFWIRSTIGSYMHAWVLENQRLKAESFFAKIYKNQMVWFSLIIVGYVTVVMTLFASNAVLFVLLAGIISFLFLETINYVEHYGLMRKQTSSGRYERVQPWHSWNSNHYLGRIILYELTRHSDHHFLANKKYQILDHHDTSPQLPYGYPSSMLISMVPPLWFSIMNKRVDAISMDPAH